MIVQLLAMLKKKGFNVPNLSFLNRKDVQEFISKHIELEKVHVYLSNDRKSKLGDYRWIPDYGIHKITINSNQSAFWFTITFLHELAHKKAFENYGFKISAHGKEWKHEYKKLLDHINFELSYEEKKDLFSLKRKAPAKRKIEPKPDAHHSFSAKDLKVKDVFVFKENEFIVEKINRTRLIAKQTTNNQRYYISKLLFVKKLN